MKIKPKKGRGFFDRFILNQFVDHDLKIVGSYEKRKNHAEIIELEQKLKELKESK